MKKIYKIFTAFFCVSLLLSCLSTLSSCRDNREDIDLSNTATQVFSSESSKNENRVIFYSDDDIILGKDDVPQGGTPKTPTQGLSKEGYIFTGWSVKPGSGETEDAGDTDKTNSTNDAQDNDQTLPQIDDDTDFETNYIDIRDKSNVFAFPAVYGQGGEIITTKLQLCGNVNLCGFDIQVIYDPAVLELLSINSDLDLDVVVSHDEENHSIKFNYAAAKNRTRAADVIEFSFKIKSPEKAKTRIQLNALEIIAIDADNDNLPVSVQFTLIDGVVYIQ